MLHCPSRAYDFNTPRFSFGVLKHNTKEEWTNIYTPIKLKCINIKLCQTGITSCHLDHFTHCSSSPLVLCQVWNSTQQICSVAGKTCHSSVTSSWAFSLPSHTCSATVWSLSYPRDSLEKPLLCCTKTRRHWSAVLLCPHLHLTPGDAPCCSLWKKDKRAKQPEPNYTGSQWSRESQRTEIHTALEIFCHETLEAQS